MTFLLQDAGIGPDIGFYDLPEAAKLPLQRPDIEFLRQQDPAASSMEKDVYEEELRRLQETIWLDGDWKQA